MPVSGTEAYFVVKYPLGDLNSYLTCPEHVASAVGLNGQEYGGADLNRYGNPGRFELPASTNCATAAYTR